MSGGGGGVWEKYEMKYEMLWWRFLRKRIIFRDDYMNNEYILWGNRGKLFTRLVFCILKEKCFII